MLQSIWLQRVGYDVETEQQPWKSCHLSGGTFFLSWLILFKFNAIFKFNNVIIIFPLINISSKICQENKCSREIAMLILSYLAKVWSAYH